MMLKSSKIIRVSVTNFHRSLYYKWSSANPLTHFPETLTSFTTKEMQSWLLHKFQHRLPEWICNLMLFKNINISIRSEFYKSINFPIEKSIPKSSSWRFRSAHIMHPNLCLFGFSGFPNNWFKINMKLNLLENDNNEIGVLTTNNIFTAQTAY